MNQEQITCLLRQVRRREGVTQPSLAEGANVVLERLLVPYPRLTCEIISQAENEAVILIPNHVHAIAAFLDCTAHDIYPNIYPVLYKREPSG